MKEAIILITVLLLTFVPNVVFKNYLEDTGNEILALLENMETDIQNEKEVDEEKSKKLGETFLEKEKYWILIVDHEILDEVENSIEECIAFYNAGDEMEFNSSFGKLRNHIEDLTRREELSLLNIL